MLLFPMVLLVFAVMRGADLLCAGERPYADRFFGKTEDGTEHVRLIGQFSSPCAVADRFDDHRRKARGKLGYEG